MKKTIIIPSILGGQGPTQYINISGGYACAIGIDPDLPANSNDIKGSGAVVPSPYAKFSGSNVNSFINWMITNIKDENVYTYLQNGRFVRYDKDLANETLIGTPTSGAGNGGNYYNNYIYLMTPTDVARYGPLNGTPALTNNFWTSTLSKTASTNMTYPSIRNAIIPNHAGYVHGDNCLYWCDVLNGQGVIHKIKTKKTTYEGDTDDGSAYNVLDLPFGLYPIAISGFGTDLAVIGIKTTSSNINQGKPYLYLWKTTEDSFYREIPLPGSIVTAIKNINGIIYIFSGDGKNGVFITKYIGGSSVIPVDEIDEGFPPFQDAVEDLGNKILWGAFTTYPVVSAAVHALGLKKSKLPKAWSTPIKTSSAGANPIVTSIKNVEQNSFLTPKVIVGWGDDSAKGIDKYTSGATLSSVIQFGPFNIGQKFSIEKMRIPFAKAVAANMQITPKVYIDDESVTKSPTVINNTNNSGKRKVIYTNSDLPDYIGDNNFKLELTWGLTVQLPVLLPIIIELDIFEDEAN